MEQLCLSTEEITSKLAQAGVFATAQRIAICKYVLCRANHPSAEEVKRWLDKNFPKVSMATVYNTLRVLVEVGLLREIHLPGRESVLYDRKVENHFHFVDEVSGKVTDVDPCAVRMQYNLGSEYQISQVDVVLHGKKKG